MEKKRYITPAVMIQHLDTTHFLELSYSGEGDGTDIAAPLRPEEEIPDFGW